MHFHACPSGAGSDVSIRGKVANVATVEPGGAPWSSDLVLGSDPLGAMWVVRLEAHHFGATSNLTILDKAVVASIIVISTVGQIFSRNLEQSE